MDAKKAGIPVILIDRNVDQTLAKAGEDYVTFIGSDFVEEGQLAAEWLVKARERQGQDHRAGGHDRLLAGQRPQEGLRRLHQGPSGHGDHRLASPATSPATRAARSPRRCSRRIRTRPRIYAHNDEMAIGAIAAMEAAGKVPGKDV